MRKDLIFNWDEMNAREIDADKMTLRFEDMESFCNDRIAVFIAINLR